MKLSLYCSLAVVLVVPHHASAFTGPEYPIRSTGTSTNTRSTSSSQPSKSSCSSPSRLQTSMSTMDILGGADEESSAASSAVSQKNDQSTSGSPSNKKEGSVTINSSSKVDMVVDWDWEAVATSVFAGDDQRPVVLFDGVCNLCNGGVNFAMDHDEEAKLRFCSLQSKTAQSLLIQAGQQPTDINKIVLVTKDRTYFSSDAVTRICQQLDLAPLQWIGQIGQVTPRWIREPIYQFVSVNRYHFGENDSCRLDFDGTLTSRFVSDPADISDV